MERGGDISVRHGPIWRLSGHVTTNSSCSHHILHVLLLFFLCLSGVNLALTPNLDIAISYCLNHKLPAVTSVFYFVAILDQFPLKDHNDVVLPPTVAMFCLPLGATIECWPAKANHPRPVFSTFVLTGAVGQRVSNKCDIISRWVTVVIWTFTNKYIFSCLKQC